jgi:hypothetical protein
MAGLRWNRNRIPHLHRLLQEVVITELVLLQCTMGHV